MRATISNHATPEMARIPDAVRITGLSRSRLYRLASEGSIRLVKVGGATLVDLQSVRAFLAALPDLVIRPDGVKGHKPQ
jgi:excisionase family DNA binding protein